MLHPDNDLNAIFGEIIQDVIDEEKRLFYVALTRTKNKLYYISEKEIPK
jgi:DNA helicase IV